MTLRLDPIRTEPAYRKASQAIEEKILSGQIEIGEALPSEMALAEQLGVNRSTVREAIRALEQNGLVSRRDGGKKLYASVPEQSMIAQRLTAAMILQQVSFEELWESMLALEPAAAAAAAGRIDAPQIERLTDNLERTRQALDDRDSLVELDIEFHNLVAEASGNRAFQLCRQPVSELFYPAFYKVMSRLNAGERLLYAHEQVVAALVAGDRETAESWMRRHIVDFRRGYELANLDLSAPVRPVGTSAGA